jgi:hypothetical protein
VLYSSAMRVAFVVAILLVGPALDIACANQDVPMPDNPGSSTVRVVPLNGPGSSDVDADVTGSASAATSASGSSISSASANGSSSAEPFQACTVDADCVAVPRVGCCHNGWNEAVNANQSDAYTASFTCADPHPICPMYRLSDKRTPECGNLTHLCEMVKPEEVRCGGMVANKHVCPKPYACRPNRVRNAPGSCERP